MKPVIAIRPTIDGRRAGVRESLETQTMQMARAAAQLIEKELRYIDGTAVQCVISSQTIGRAGEAAQAAEELSAYQVAGEITVTPCWCYTSEVLDFNPKYPHAVWGFNGTERPGAVMLAAALSAYAQFGVPAFGIYGKEVIDADDLSIPEDVAEKILTFARSALAIAQMQGKNYLQIGSACMGIAGSVVDWHFFRDYIGMGVESVDMTELLRRIDGDIYDPLVYQQARKWVQENMRMGADRNDPTKHLTAKETEEQWDFVTKMLLIGADLMSGNPRLAELGFGEEAAGHNAILAGFQGQRQWTDYRPNGDFLETMLNTSFDWNGPRQPKILATENDALNGAAMLFNYLLTNRAQMFSDVRTYWSAAAIERVTGEKPTGKAANGLLDLRNSGATTLDATGAMKDQDGHPVIKPWWEVTNDDIQAALQATTFHPATKEYFRGGGFSTHFTTAADMPLTMCRINLVHGLGPVMQICEGWSVLLSEKATDIIVERTDPTWPTTFFAPRLTGEGAFTSVYEVMENWGANHGAIGYGHFGDQLITLAAMLRIPVHMHNVEPERIFRPRAWRLHGTADPEGADFRACSTYGPIYR